MIGRTNAGGGGGSIPVSPPFNIVAKTEQNTVTINFDIKEDVTRYVTVIKKGSEPTSPHDGFTNPSKPAVFPNLDYDEEYFVKVYTYNSGRDVNTAEAITFTCTSYKVMTVIIDQSDSNPATCCTYADDAVGMTPGSAEWDEFLGHYPVLFKEGQEVGKLNRNNFAEFEDGSSADITSGNAGDVMIAFPKLGIKINTVGDVVSVSVTDNPNAEADGFEYNAHISYADGVSIVDKFYVGAFKGYNSSGKLRSLSGKTITANQNIGTFRNYAQANGSGYCQSSYYRLLFRQCLYLLKYRNLDSQTAVGRGYVDGNNVAITTGGTVSKGMDFGETTGKLQCKCLGIEDFWGNIHEFIDGIWVDSSRNITIGTKSFNDTGSGYSNAGSSGFTSDAYGYINKVQGDTKKGFIIKSEGGSLTTYYCDYGYCGASRMGCFGGYWNNASYAGAFRLDLDRGAANTGALVGGRLEFCA